MSSNKILSEGFIDSVIPISIGFGTTGGGAAATAAGANILLIQ